VSQFVHLHLHSEFSLLDGANKTGDLVNRVKELGMPAVALTDHGVMFGAIDFYKKCKAAGVKPIVGCEAYISPTTRDERGPKATSNHLVLLAQNYTGYLNLCKLTSVGYLEGFYRKPRIDHEVLAAHSEGLIALSGCLKGEVAESFTKQGVKAAIERAGRYREIFGSDRFFLEIQDHGIPEQQKLVRSMRGIAGELGLNIVASNDAHYLTGNHAEPHDCLLCIGTGKRKSDPNRMKYYAPEFYIKSPRQMYDLFSEFPNAVGRTVEIAEACNCEIPFHQKLYPKFDLPEGVTDVRAYLRERVYEGSVERYGRLSEQLKSQIDFELSVIEKTGFEDYFLVVWDFIKYAREQGIPVGPGRGSGAGSIVAYALKITDVDPIEHGLLFERFLNPERVSAPDFDIDFCFERRGEVIDYVKRKYGKDNVAQIITFGTLKPKAAIRDVGRVLEVPLQRVDQIAKMLPEGPAGPKNLDIALKDIPDLKKEYDSDQIIKELIDTAKAIEGTSRHASVHAAGVVIADRELASLIPIYQPAGTEDRVVQYTMGTVEELGFLKMDFLGLKNLTIIQNALTNVKHAKGEEIDFDKIPLDEPDTYKFLRKGITMGLFQLESSGMRDVVKRLKPSTFADISAVLALYRPGPMEAGMVDDYIERKHGRAEIDYFHPLLQEVLSETYGTIIYQEQVMKIAQIMAGYSLGSADLLRRAMGKKKAEVMDAERPKFIKGCLEQGHDEELAHRLFDIMAKFAGYGFNKSHTVAYAMITFRTAYLMAHHKTCYLAALLTNEIHGNKAQEKIPHYIKTCREMGVDVLGPDINESRYQFAVVPVDEGEELKTIRFGMGAVKGVGRAVVDAIVAEREKDGPYEGLHDFCERVPHSGLNGRAVEALIRVGAFDSLLDNRAAALKVFPELLEMGADGQREKASGQTNLLAMMMEAPANGSANGNGATNGNGSQQIPLPDVPDLKPFDKLKDEKELIGFYVSGHPLDRWKRDFDCFGQLSSADLAAMAAAQEQAANDALEGNNMMAQLRQQSSSNNNGNSNQRHMMMGLVATVNNRISQKGNPYAFLQLEDYFGYFEVAVWGKAYPQFQNLLVAGDVLAIEGRVDVEGRSPKIIADKVYTPEMLRKQRVKFIDIYLDGDQMNARNLTPLLQTVGRHAGSTPCRFAVCSGDQAVIVEPGKKLKINPVQDALRDLEKVPVTREVRFYTGK
jgi:DNA polymerase-3 subunit alpha